MRFLIRMVWRGIVGQKRLRRGGVGGGNGTGDSRNGFAQHADVPPSTGYAKTDYFLHRTARKKNVSLNACELTRVARRTFTPRVNKPCKRVVNENGKGGLNLNQLRPTTLPRDSQPAGQPRIRTGFPSFSLKKPQKISTGRSVLRQFLFVNSDVAGQGMILSHQRDVAVDARKLIPIGLLDVLSISSSATRVPSPEPPIDSGVEDDHHGAEQQLNASCQMIRIEHR